MWAGGAGVTEESEHGCACTRITYLLKCAHSLHVAPLPRRCDVICDERVGRGVCEGGGGEVKGVVSMWGKLMVISRCGMLQV